MPTYYRNEYLFSEIYLEEITQIPEQAEVLASLNTLKEYRDYSDISRLLTWKDSFVHQVLYALGFNIQSESENVTQLFPMGSTEKPISICYILLPGENLDNTTMGRNWAEMIIRNLREHDMQWGLLTNGEQWRIYHQDEPTPYETYLEIDLVAILADKARDAYQIFHKFMRAENFTVGSDGQCQFDVFKKESQDKIDYIEKELENALKQKEEGGQGVLSRLCMGYVEYLREHGNPDLEDEELRRKIYHGAMLYMFRLLFLYYADARGLLSDDNHRLLEDVRQTAYDMSHSGNAFEKNYGLWQDLETIFVDIDQTYNGGLFNPHESEFTLFIEESKILDVHLAPAVYHLAFYHEKSGEERLISYKDMSVRHLGTLYEGLLEHKLFITKEDTEVRITKGVLKFVPQSKGGKAIQGKYIPRGQVYFGSDASERKSTGSYYTPDYIVGAIIRETIANRLFELRDELIMSQKPNINAIHRALGKDERIALLHLLSSESVAFIRNKILTLKILDPAMGSGHFLVNTVNLVSNAITEMLNAFDLQTFEETSTKLWRRDVVENCIFGVDINPLAVELTKLSLWILSMYDEKPLSFLEHHLKIGNSLVGSRIDELGAYPIIDGNPKAEQKGLFSKRQDFQMVLKEAISKLKRISQTRSIDLHDILTKKELLAETEKSLEPYRNLANIHSSIKSGIAISEWEYYELIEKIESSTNDDVSEERKYFQWELEFPFLLVGDRFDVVIGNPPYGASLSESEKVFVNHSYPLSDSQNETYLLFIEKGLDLLNSQGMIGMIIPNTWLTNLKGDNFRKYLFDHVMVRKIIHYKWLVFDGATISVEIVILKKSSFLENNKIKIHIANKSGMEVYELPQMRWQDANGSPINVFERPEYIDLADKLRVYPKLDDICNITQGSKPFQVGKGKPPQTRDIVDAKPYVSDNNRDGTFRPLLRGSLMGRYRILWNNNYWIKFGDWLAEPRYSANYDAPEKIVIRQTGDSLVATLDNNQFVIRDNLYSITPKKPGVDLRVILGIINSHLLNWFFQNIIQSEAGEPLAQVKRIHLAQLPISLADESNRDLLSTQLKLSDLVGKLLSIYKSLNNVENKSEELKIISEASMIENTIDQLIYELYNVKSDDIKLITDLEKVL